MRWCICVCVQVSGFRSNNHIKSSHPLGKMVQDVRFPGVANWRRNSDYGIRFWRLMQQSRKERVNSFSGSKCRKPSCLKGNRHRHLIHPNGQMFETSNTRQRPASLLNLYTSAMMLLQQIKDSRGLVGSLPPLTSDLMIKSASSLIPITSFTNVAWMVGASDVATINNNIKVPD